MLPHIQQALQRDFERHRFWLVVDTIGLVISGLLAIVPARICWRTDFLFRVGGHWLSMRGATQGRRRVPGKAGRANRSLTFARHCRCRAASATDASSMFASTLHLRHLPTFFERVTADNDAGYGIRAHDSAKTSE